MNSETKVTERPWHTSGDHIYGPSETNPYGGAAVAEVMGDTPEQAAMNMDFIVRAVNTHDAMLALLKEIARDGIVTGGYERLYKTIALAEGRPE